jgi:hypothetical protein
LRAGSADSTSADSAAARESKGAGPLAGYIVLFILCIGGLSGAILGVAARTAPKSDVEPSPPTNKQYEPPTSFTTAEAPTPAPPPPADEGKLEITDLVVGKGAEAKSGDEVSTHYVGTLLDGKEFDASRKHGDQPFKFKLGGGRVIKGWDQGIVGMRVGGKRKLVIPPSMGYGARGAGGTIPPNATLVFEVELVDVKPSTP